MNDVEEKNQIARGSGKWSEPGVPNKGWVCVGIDDLGAPDEICQMCEKREIRYVHQMEHPNYPDALGVGCVCAGHMEGDYEGARSREQGIKNASRRRSTWLKRKWRTSQKGNPYIKTDGYHIVLYKQGSGWRGTITHRASGQEVKSRRGYATLEEAKLAAFDGMIFLTGQE